MAAAGEGWPGFPAWAAPAWAARGAAAGRAVAGPEAVAPAGPDHGDGKKGLQTLSMRTGGAYFEVGKKDTLDKIYDKIKEDLRSQYSLGCTPDANAQGGYRGIKVEVQRKNLVVQAREGYYPAERS